MRMRPDIEAAMQLDQQIANGEHREAFQSAMWAWSRNVRNAIGLPLESLAKRMRVSKQAMSKLEQNELSGAISLAKLEAIAHTLDCEFVYGFVPRSSFTEMASHIQNQQEKARKAKRRIPAPE